MEFFARIKSYLVSYVAGGQNTQSDYRATIILRDDNDRIVGSLHFYRDPATMPAHDSLTNANTSSAQAHLHYPAEAFPQVIDLLRNEKPVSLLYYWGEDAMAGTGSLETAYEPVGDGELPVWLRRIPFLGK